MEIWQFITDKLPIITVVIISIMQIIMMIANKPLEVEKLEAKKQKILNKMIADEYRNQCKVEKIESKIALIESKKENNNNVSKNNRSD